MSAAHQDFLDLHCARIDDLDLIDEAACAQAHTDEPYWLIVHSGPTEEVAELIAYADEIRSAEGSDVPLWVASPCVPRALPAATHLLDAHPVDAWFAGAARIFSAAGFNIMRQTRAHRSRHSVLPMPRRYDDQYERARRAFLHPR